MAYAGFRKFWVRRVASGARCANSNRGCGQVKDVVWLHDRGPGQFGFNQIVEQHNVVVDTNSINGSN